MRKNFSLTLDQKDDARRALALLEGTGISLEEAAKWVSGVSGAIRRSTYEAAVEEFLLAKKREKRALTTRQWYAQALHAAGRSIGPGRWMHEITTEEVREAAGDSNRGRALRVFFRWAAHLEEPMVRENPARSLEVANTYAIEREVEILDPEEVHRALASCYPYTSALALVLFAGVRIEELGGAKGKPPLRWQHIDCEEHWVRVPAANAKTRRSRVNEGMPPTLWKYMYPQRPSEPVCPGTPLQASRVFQRAAGYRTKRDAPLRPWPRNAMRHSFGTYHIALTNDPALTGLLMGHEGNSQTTLYRHYRGLATRKQAERFFC